MIGTIVELLIGFTRPESMSDSQMRSWINDRARTGRPALTVGRAGAAEAHELLWVTAASDAVSSAEDQVSDLLLDMRLLGLRPTIMAHPGALDSAAPS